MAIRLTSHKAADSKPIYLLTQNTLQNGTLPQEAINWLKAQDFKAKEATALTYPDATGAIGGAVIGMGDGANPLAAGALAKHLKQGNWHFAEESEPTLLHALGLVMGSYRFTRYHSEKEEKHITLAIPAGVNFADLTRQAETVTLVRDLINTPANDMNPQTLESSARNIAEHYGADITVTVGDDLLTQNFPLIHAVGRAGAIAPRLIDLRWGKTDAPKVTLIGKGVCFDTGGLDLKSASGMLLMKKDMGGAANVLGLAKLIMDAKLPIQLRVLIPAVENSVSGNAFRPGDILKSRLGLTVEIGNTDAEGRLVLADALTLASEDSPDLIFDMATLTGAARVALGPDLPPFFTDDGELAEMIKRQSCETHDPLWQLPLWQPYMKKLASPIADINNTTTDGFAGSVTAALFLHRFVGNAKSWAHFDIYGWTPVDKPAFPKGGEAQGIRALYAVLCEKYGC